MICLLFCPDCRRNVGLEDVCPRIRLRFRENTFSVSLRYCVKWVIDFKSKKPHTMESHRSDRRPIPCSLFRVVNPVVEIRMWSL